MKQNKKNSNTFYKIAFYGGLTTAIVAGINQLVFMSATSRNMLSGNDDLYYNWRFGKIFYTKEGKGTPVLLIHELQSTGSDFEWKSLRKELKKTHTVYTIDLLGCGRSEKPHFIYTNFLYVQLITDFIREIIGQKCDVITSGNASSLTLMASAYQPERFQRLIFINPEDLTKTYQYPEKREKLMRQLIELPVFGTALYNLIHSALWIKINAKKHQFYNPANIRPIQMQAFHEAAHLGHYSAKHLFGCLKANYTQIPVLSALRKSNHPLIIVGGTAQPRIEQIIADYKEYHPSVLSELIPNSIQYPHLEQPEQTSKVLVKYLNH